MSETINASRRGMIVGGAALAVTLPGTASALGWGARSLAYQQFDDWKGQIGTSYTLRDDAAAAPIRLIAVKNATRLRGARGRARSHSFTALFEMDQAAAPEGGRAYRIEHPEFGVADLYLDRTTRKDGRMRFRASFN